MSLAIPAISQGVLQTLDTCPRQFQYQYLQQFSQVEDPIFSQRQRWGQQFHRLMQQVALGLPVEAVADADPELYACLERLLADQPWLVGSRKPGEQRQVEIRLSLYFDNVLLTGVYDLLVRWISPVAGGQSPDQTAIHDWKTGVHQPASRSLKQRWQTRLYLFLLAEASGLPPETLTMTYWFVRQSPIQSVKVPYSRRAHQATAQDLRRLLDQLQQLIVQPQLLLPALAADSPACRYCAFASFCHGQLATTGSRGRPSNGVEAVEPPLDWEAIEPLPL
jgi:CRISPR/Cas system-associated exonuclease Cas4 (RecB family)